MRHKANLAIALLFLAVLPTWSIAAGPPKHGEITQSVLNVSALGQGQKAWAAVVVEIQDGFHAQSHTPLDENFIKFELKFDENPLVKIGTPRYPAGRIEDYPALGKLSVYTGKTVILVPIDVPADAKTGPVEITGRVQFQACDDKVCYPPEQPKFSIKSEIVPASASVKPNEPELFKDVEKAGAQTSDASPAPMLNTRIAGAEITPGMVAWKFFIAFLVGIIFNVMPCVLPVLPLKAVGFYNAAQHSRARSVAFGAVFSLGLIATFAVFGILIFVTRSFNWGQLFTYTWFQIAIVVILLALAASTFGLFTVRLPVGVYNAEAKASTRHDTYLGNFLFGIFTAVLSTPCTFGLFVGLLAWAISLNAPAIGVTMLIMVGVGMASPYFLLSATPELARRFPQTGPWAELVKQMMGFLLLVAAVYFARPFIGRVVHGEAFWWVPFGVIIIACAFLVIRTVQFAKTPLPMVVSITLAAVILVGAFSAVQRLTFRPFEWQPFSTTALDEARTQNRIVLVEFTADWCGNCQYVEARVLHSADIVRTVRDREIVMLKADVTRGDAPARPLLEQLNPAGSIPLTVIYSPHTPTPIELTGIYSTTDLQKALDQAASKQPALATAR
jgi:thiol:disulfide interchange protein DsbD